MNDIDFLGMVETFRKVFLLLFNSSLFWTLICSWLFIGSFNAFKRQITSPPRRSVSRETKPKKSWCYDE